MNQEIPRIGRYDSMNQSNNTQAEQFTLRLPSDLLNSVKTHARKAAFFLNQDVSHTDVIRANLNKRFGPDTFGTGSTVPEADYLLESHNWLGLTPEGRASKINQALAKNKREGACPSSNFEATVVVTSTGVVIEDAYTENVHEGVALRGVTANKVAYDIPSSILVMIITCNGYQMKTEVI